MSYDLNTLFANHRIVTDELARKVRMGERHTGEVIAAIDRVADIRAAFLRNKIGIEGDRNLSTQGRQGKIADMARGMMKEVARVSARPRKALAYQATQVAGLMEPTRVDPTDAVGELRRQEIRSYMRGLKPHERMSFANAMVSDEMGRAAILDAPPVMSGLEQHFYGQFRTQVAEHVNGPRLAELKAVAADYEYAKAAADVLRNEVLKDSGLTPQAFGEQMAALDAEAERS